MTVLKICCFVTLFLIFLLASCIDASCETEKGETIKAGATRIVKCETLYLCDQENQLHIYPACPKLRCKKLTKHRDLDTSKPWPQCCSHHTCRAPLIPNKL